MLSVNYAECRKQVHYAECRYAECRYAECRYAECRGASNPTCIAYDGFRSAIDRMSRSIQLDWRHNIQPNDAQHNDIQNNSIQQNHT
jgi:hypothetical protein